MSKWNVTKDTKSDSYIISFSYVDDTGRRQRYRRSAGKGLGRREAERQAADLYRLHERDKRVFIEQFAQPEPPPPPVAFSGLAMRWYAEHVQVVLRPSTQRTHEQILRVHLVAHFGDADASAITQAMVKKYVAEKVASGLNKKSVNNHLSVLRSVLDYGVKPLEVLERNPVADVHALQVGDVGFQWLNAGESVRLLDAVRQRDPEFQLLFSTALGTGMRLGELCALRWGDVDLDRKRIHVRHSVFRGKLGPTKGGRTRQVPLPASLAEELMLARQERGSDAYVFTQRDGSPLNRDMIKHPHTRAVAAIGRGKIRFHDLRHSYASQLVAERVPLVAVKQLLGHADIKTTLRYAHLAPDHLDEAVQVLDRRRA